MRRFRKRISNNPWFQDSPLPKFITSQLGSSMVQGHMRGMLHRQALPNRRIPIATIKNPQRLLRLYKDLTALYEADLKASQKAGLGPVAQRLLQKIQKKAEVKPRRLLRRYPGENYFPTDRFGAGCERRPQSPLHARDERQPYS